MLHRILKGAAPVAAMALGLMAAGCKDVEFRWGNGEEDGVPLAELDYEGATPDKVALLGPDTVVVTEGKTLTIKVEGDSKAVEALRFKLNDGTFGVSRASGSRGIDGVATVRITMPSPRALMLAGSGGIAAQTLADRAEIDIAGSGRVDVASVRASRLEVNVAGSGSTGVAGTAESLELNIVGSGQADLGELKVDAAEVNIMGSGSGEFASDGQIEANVMGSGTVTVSGNAECKINAMGSGSLRCRPAKDAPTAGSSDTPAAPEAPPETD